MKKRVFNILKVLPMQSRLKILKILAGWKNARDIQKRDKDIAQDYASLKARFKATHGRELNLEVPRLFNEKVQWRKLRDPNPMFALVSDKTLAKGWAEERLGENLSVPDLFVVSDPIDLPEDIATTDCMLKVTHASGRNIVIRAAECRSRTDIVLEIAWMLYRDYGHNLHEGHYQEIDRKIVAEPLLVDSEGNPPSSLRVHSFDGKPFCFQYDTADFDPIVRKATQSVSVFLTPDWELLPVTRDGMIPDDFTRPAPLLLPKVLDAAQKLSCDFDYMRVDFFLLGEELFLSELSLFPSSGFRLFEPESFAEEMGDAWTLRNVASKGGS
ncbi:MAG: hypothetical protein KJN60_02375 [Boseongicola sp.]|nr:hypothetical protein [Boseongicola sp.]